MEIGEADDTELRVRIRDRAAAKVKRGRFFRAWAVIIVSVALGYLGGFLITTFLLLFGFALISGDRKRLAQNTLIGTGVTLLTYLIFGLIMRVPLLESIISQWF